MASIHFRNLLLHTCTIERASNTQTTSGQLTPTWASTYTDVPCRFVAKVNRYAQENIGFMMRSDFMMLFNNGVDVLESDRCTNIRLKDGTLVDADAYTVETLLKRNSTKPHHISVMLEKIE